MKEQIGDAANYGKYNGGAGRVRDCICNPFAVQITMLRTAFGM
jgi:hypothetical protein